MPEAQLPTQPHEVESTEIVKGRLVIGTKAFNLPVPTLLANIDKAIRKFCVLMVASVSGSTIFNGNQSKEVTFILAMVIALSYAVDAGFGIKSTDDK